MSDDYSYYRRDPRFTVGSGLLLAIFVSAVLFVAYVAYTMAPWEGDEPEPETAVAETAGEEPEDSGKEQGARSQEQGASSQ